jgi:hypothetical protein
MRRLRRWWREQTTKRRKAPQAFKSDILAPLDEGRNAHLAQRATLQTRAPPPPYILKLPPAQRATLQTRAPPPPYILKLPPALLICIVNYLDYPSIIFFKIACKQLNNAIPIPRLPPTHEEKLAVLRLFPANSTFEGDRSPPYLCKDCMMWHTFEHLVIYPHPFPESVFHDHKDFAIQKPRVCVRYARLTGRWIPGKLIDKNYILCPACNTPRNVKEKKCSWNCQRCSACTGRKAWSAMCVACWREGDGDVLRKKAAWDPPESVHSLYAYRRGGAIMPPRRNGGGGSSRSRTVCGRCLGILDFVPGSVEVCRCAESRHSFSDDH